MARSLRSLEKLPLDAIKPDTPIRLDTAALIAFPAGGMTAAGLRTEARKGRLLISNIAGKDFTTLLAIQEMIRLCHVRSPVLQTDTTEAAEAALERARASVRQLSERGP